MHYVYIAIFGALGAAARYGISITFETGIFPYNTLFINVIGCFLLAIVVTYLSTFSKLSHALITGLGTGLIGSFTTFSAFSIQACDLLLGGHYFIASAYILSSLIGGFLSAAVGVYVSNKLIAGREIEGND
ncbi:fluoride efflux transporter FluC [Clostridium aminobutyricum]|uniref:Fluoride-specific ion channel FluC n=1 Tax=Clostridium aminobutyricum TaxID=33953 RepID=A0A939IK34_CLOAM|nr:CrcB family protein [Clostridium aminobutyricum]MBN7774223.1 CrcB family protein [Clostridium aminobutyricum]